MKVISLSGSLKPLKNTCAAIGIFDGVHRGHQYLIKRMSAAARRLHARPVVITFFPHPAHVLQPNIRLGYLTSLHERLCLLKDLGVSLTVVVPFTRAFAAIEPERFIQHVLVKKLGVKAVFVGEDFKFGKDRKGDIALFEKLAFRYGYEIHAVPALKQGGEVISSTRIRGLIENGPLSKAAQLLGRRVFISGRVARGSHRGKTLGFATANIDYQADILPSQGVYIVLAYLGKKAYPALANIGTRPSFEKQVSKTHVEVYLLDFSKSIYGKHLKIEFLKKIRNEKKFSGPQQLIRQIQKDEVVARHYFKANN